MTIERVPKEMVKGTDQVKYLSSYYGDLAAAVADIGSDVVTLVINVDPVDLAVDLDLSATNISLDWKSGCVLGGAYTLTIGGSLNAGAYQIFGSDLTVVLSLQKDIVSQWFGMSVLETAANNEAYFEKMVGAIVSGQNITIPPGDYDVEDQLSIDTACIINAYGVKFDWVSDTSVNRGIVISVSDVTIKGIELDGPQFATQVGTQKGILATGIDNNPAAPTIITNIKLRDIKAYNWGMYALNVTFVDGFEITDCEVSDCYAGGIVGLSAVNGIIKGNRINNIIDPVSAYGIQLTRNDGGDFVRRPVCANILVSDNIVKDIPSWHAYDTHGGNAIHFINNISIDCFQGIALAVFSNGTDKQGPTDCKIIGNTCVNETLATTAVGQGIHASGILTSFGSGSVITGNTVRGHGKSDAAYSAPSAAGIYTQFQSNLIMSDNVVIDSGKIGISTRSPGDGISIMNNNIIGITGAGGTAYFFDTNAAGGGTGGVWLDGGQCDVPGQTGIFMEENMPLRIGIIDWRDYTTLYGQTGGVVSNQYVKKIQSVISGVDDSWNPASIAAGSFELHTITPVPGVSSSSSAVVSVNRDLEGLVLSWKCGDVDTNDGDIDVYLYNNTAGAIDIGSLKLRYKVSQRL